VNKEGELSAVIKGAGTLEHVVKEGACRFAVREPFAKVREREISALAQKQIEQGVAQAHVFRGGGMPQGS
jgi:hypothetical protein